MRALIRTEQGVALVERPSPVAGDGEAIVDVAYAGICRSDLAAADGAVPVGRVLGHELSGWIGKTPVAVIPFTRGRWLGIDRDGAFAERVCVPTACLIPLPADMLLLGAYVEPVAAALGVLASIEPGDHVRIGGTGRIAELTARVVAAHGANVIDEGSADVAIETDGNVVALLPALRDGGTLVLKSRARRMLTIDMGELVARDLTVRGASHGSFTAAIDWLHARKIVVDDLLAPPRLLEEFEGVFTAARASEAQKQMFAIGARL